MIKVIPTGSFQVNTCFFVDDETKHGFLIDPGSEASKLLRYIEEEDLVIEKIILTHGHFDHIGAVKEISEILNIPVYVHSEGKIYLKDPKWNLSGDSGFGMELISIEATDYVEHGDIISLESNPKMELRVIHVPGHSLDGVAFYNENEKVAFVGDIIFNGSVGRSDLIGSNGSDLLAGIKRDIFTLPEETVIYPGHGPSTTVRHEKTTNPYFNMFGF